MAPAICQQPFFHVRRFLLPLILLLSFNASRKYVLARCIQEHHDSLLLLKSSFKYATVPIPVNSLDDPKPTNFSSTFPNDSKLASWRPNTDCCKWEGVTCNDTESPSPGHVTALDLGYSSLSGNIHPALFNLNSLRTLDLSDNYFINLTLPSSGFEKLKNLTELVLYNCRFVGKLPTAISRLTNLAHLDLFSNGFVGDVSDVISPQLNQLTYLDISFNEFTGFIPASIANLTQLTTLDLTFNHLKGSLPLFNPTTPISQLILNYNMLIGSIPLLYSQLHWITVLSLRDNSLTGFIPTSLFSHPTLEQLDLVGNIFSDFQGEFSNISSVLRVIRLGDSRLQGPIPHVFYKMPQLETLYLSNNNLTGSVDLCDFKSFANLTRLVLSHNRLTVHNSKCDFFLPKFHTLWMSSCNLTQFPELLREQNSIQDLDFSMNQIQGLIPKWVWNNSYTWLNLSHNLLEGVEESIHGSLGSFLFFMDLQSNRLRSLLPFSSPNMGSIPSNIGLFIKEAIYFSLAKNDLVGEIPSSFCDAKNLSILDLSHNNLSGPLPPCLANMTSLATLNVQGNLLSGTIPQEFSSGCALEIISMNGNMLQGEVPDSLSNCDKLQMLDIGNNGIVNVFPLWIGKLPELKVLILRNNRFHGMLPKIWKGTFSKLQILDLSSNQFVGYFPDDMFMNLRAMKTRRASDLSSRFFINNSYARLYYTEVSFMGMNKGRPMDFTNVLTIHNSLDLSNNGFDGQISEQIGELIALNVLNLSTNHLCGDIPRSLERLTQLESMDLSQNYISGGIPSELLALHFLEVLNLSYNQLVGEIPWGSQFSTFTKDVYIGNKGLCGPPLSKSCRKNDYDKNDSYHSSVKELSWCLISVEVGFIVGLGSWFVILFSSVKLRTWLYIVSCEIQGKISVSSSRNFQLVRQFTTNGDV